MVLGGGSKSFKTWCLADLAISIATGSSWWGLDTVQGTVVYLNFEIQAGFFQSRLRAIANAKGVALNENLLVWNLRGFSRPAHELMPEVIKQLEGRNVVAIFMAFIGFRGIIDSQLKGLSMNTNTVESITTNATTLQPGFYLFTAFVLFSLALSELLKRTLYHAPQIIPMPTPYGGETSLLRASL